MMSFGSLSRTGSQVELLRTSMRQTCGEGRRRPVHLPEGQPHYEEGKRWHYTPALLVDEGCELI